jgi:hypothetical protein
MLPIFPIMALYDPRTETLNLLRERRERLATELASLEPVSPAEGGLTARELAIWRQRLAELDGRIARYDAPLAK